MKHTRNALFASGLSLFVSLMLMVGMTYAWFSDAIINQNNMIVTGSLSVDLLMDKDKNEKYSSIRDEKGSLFSNEVGKNGYGWESGKTEIVYLAVSNNGDLNIKYNIDLDITGDLAGALEYALIMDVKSEQSLTTWDEISKMKDVQIGEATENITLSKDIEILANPNKNAMHYFAIAIHMKDNMTSQFQGQSVDLSLTVNATQLANQTDEKMR